MKIQIQQLTKRGLINSIINRSSLKNYIFLSKIKNKNVWVKQDFYDQVISKLKKKVAPKTYRKEKGSTELMGKKYIRFRFALWRYNLSTEERIKILFEKLQKKYNLVKKQGKEFPTQRIGLSFASEEKKYSTFTYAKTKRERTIELYDTITTSTYANNDPSTEGMFDELYEKVLNYFFKKSKSPSLLDEDETKTAKHFFVFFVEE